jgi:hypothetical protein
MTSMRNILPLLLISTLLTNCNNSQTKPADKNDRIELIPEPDKHERLLGVAIQKLKKNNCDFSEPDTSLNGIILRNSKSADNVIGTDNKIDEKEQYHFYSLMGAETLTLTKHPGDGKNQISVFRVSYSDKADYGYKQLKVENFQTEKGIKLGLTKKQLIEKLGNCYAVVDSTENCIELYYRIENPKDSKTKILESNNMPVYYATYTFCNDKLRYYEFGFEYP